MYVLTLINENTDMITHYYIYVCDKGEGTIMELKCGRNTYLLNGNDLILFNGACYTLITRKERSGYFAASPTVAKIKAKKLIKEGRFIKTILENPPYKGKGLEYYKFIDI